MNQKYTNIRVLVARSMQAVDDCQCDDVRECDTVKEAKDFARYALTDAYQQSGEFSEPMNYSRVMIKEDGKDVCLFDLFRKGYVQPVEPEDDIPAGNIADDNSARHLGDETPANFS